MRGQTENVKFTVDECAFVDDRRKQDVSSFIFYATSMHLNVIFTAPSHCTVLGHLVFHLRITSRDVYKARGVKAKAKARDMQGQGQVQDHRPKAKTKAKNAKVNCWENASVNLSIILSHFRYSLEKLQ